MVEDGKETKKMVESNIRPREVMKPWEQHSTVISIPRFDYNVPSSLLHHSHPGFLITCPIKREKSATKEAMSILEKCLGTFSNSNCENLESSDENDSIKRRKLCMEDMVRGCLNEGKLNHADNSGDTTGVPEDQSLPSEKLTALERGNALSLVKLTRSGLLLFTFPRHKTPDVVDAVSNIIQSLESGSIRSPLWCHRIFPIQATCSLNKMELQAVVSRLVVQFVSDKRNRLSQPIKFAVGFNRRGIEDTKEMKRVMLAGNNSDAFVLLDRNKCFEAVAEAVKNSVSDAVVDLQCPELSVLVEVLPISGLPNESILVAVSILPCYLVNTKPRLCIKALVSGSKDKNGKNN